MMENELVFFVNLFLYGRNLFGHTQVIEFTNPLSEGAVGNSSHIRSSIWMSSECFEKLRRIVPVSGIRLCPLLTLL